MNIEVKHEGELLDYLVNNVDISRKKLKSYLVHGSIYVNNNRVTKYNYKVGYKDIIIIDKDKKSNFLFNIIYEDDNIIVVDKPSGLLTISTKDEKDNTLYHMVREYVKSKNKHNKIFIVHRLDKDTSGVVLFSKKESLKYEFQDNWDEYVKLREYICIVHGNLDKKSGRIINYLAESKTKLVYITDKLNGKKAITNYKVIKENDWYSELLVDIDTGRRNQIRVAFKSIDKPILGDSLYGIKDKFDRLYLHASKLKIYYPKIGKDVLFESKVPYEFKKIMKKR